MCNCVSVIKRVSSIKIKRVHLKQKNHSVARLAVWVSDRCGIRRYVVLSGFVRNDVPPIKYRPRSCHVGHMMLNYEHIELLLLFLAGLVIVYTSSLSALLNEEFLSQVLGLIGPVQLSTPQNNLIAPAGTELFAQSSPSDQESIPKNNVLFGGRLAHAAAAFLLACNWHFCSIAIRQETPDKESSHVPLIKALLRHPNASQHFLELVVQAFNRCCKFCSFPFCNPS